MLLGHGPFDAAVDLDGGDGGGGFAQLTLWHNALLALARWDARMSSRAV